MLFMAAKKDDVVIDIIEEEETAEILKNAYERNGYVVKTCQEIEILGS